MSRNPNVAELEKILHATLPRSAPERQAHELARVLAARGVLAVDSLTDEQAANMVWSQSIHEQPELLRAALRRCATGEPEA